MDRAIPSVLPGLLALALGIMPLLPRLSHPREWHDVAAARRNHANPAPRLGGVGIFLAARLNLLLQIAAAALLAAGGYTVASIGLPGVGTISLGVAAWPVTILWIVAIANAVNLVDGVDGLAGGISGIAALSMALIAILTGRDLSALVSLCLVGALVGFLVYNLPSARANAAPSTRRTGSTSTTA